MKISLYHVFHSSLCFVCASAKRARILFKVARIACIKNISTMNRYLREEERFAASK